MDYGQLIYRISGTGGDIKETRSTASFILVKATEEVLLSMASNLRRCACLHKVS